jgi:D-glycero-D-manno-heptose 1,7-bisphosphate phosphatase
VTGAAAGNIDRDAASRAARNRAVFLDRDGTVIQEVGYLDRIDRLELFPETVDALRLLQRAGLRLIIATNQSGIGQGLFTEAFVRDLHDHLTGRLAQGGVRLDGIYYCPHHPTAKLAEYRTACDCRKPSSGLLRQAARDLDLDLARSYMIGDRWRDLQAGQAIGTAGVLVRTGYGETEAQRPPDGAVADVVVDNLAAAASWILLQERRQRSEGSERPERPGRPERREESAST